MEYLPKVSWLEFRPNTLEEVRKLYNLDKTGEMDKAINILDEWVKGQHHFTKKDFSRGYLERIIITCKGSVERAKQRMDKFCTVKNIAPSFFNVAASEIDLNRLDDMVLHTVLPKMTDDYCRVFLIKGLEKSVPPQMTLDCMKIVIYVLENIRNVDYFLGCITIFDYTEVNMNDSALNFKIDEIRQLATILTEGYGIRFKGLHLVSRSKVIDILITIMKQVTSKKVRERIQLHKTYETLYEYIPKEILPIEYGGTERSLKTLHKEMFEVLGSKEYRDHYDEMNNARTDESLRQTDKFNDQYLGMPGTFRTLCVD